MSSSTTTSIIEAIQNECQYLDDLIDLLKTERQALATSQLESLETIAAQKESLTEKLEASATARLKAMNITSSQSQKADIAKFIATLDAASASTIKSLNTELAERLSLCHDLNNVNGQVIATNIHTRADIISALTGQDIENALNTYSATGEVGHNTQTQHHEKA